MSLVESSIFKVQLNMAEALSPFVYWGQTSDTVFLKIALRNTEVSEILSLVCVTVSCLSIYFPLAFTIVDATQCEWRCTASSATEMSG